MLQESTGSLRGLVRQLSIDQFENEGRRVMGAESAIKAAPNDRTPIFERHSMDPGSIHKVRHQFKHATGLVGGCEERCIWNGWAR